MSLCLCRDERCWFFENFNFNVKKMQFALNFEPINFSVRLLDLVSELNLEKSCSIKNLPTLVQALLCNYKITSTSSISCQKKGRQIPLISYPPPPPIIMLLLGCTFFDVPRLGSQKAFVPDEPKSVQAVLSDASIPIRGSLCLGDSSGAVSITTSEWNQEIAAKII